MDKSEDINNEEYIKLIFLSYNSKQAKKMIEEDKNIADIQYRGKTMRGCPLTEIRIVDEIATVSNLAHEFGHFLQFCIENRGIKCLHEEEVSFLLEDTMKDFLRKKVYGLNKLR